MPVRLYAGLEIELLDRFPANSHQTYAIKHALRLKQTTVRRLSEAAGRAGRRGEPKGGASMRVVLILISQISNYYRENLYYKVLLSISEFTWNSYNIQIIYY